MAILKENLVQSISCRVALGLLLLHASNVLSHLVICGCVTCPVVSSLHSDFLSLETFPAQSLISWTIRPFFWGLNCSLKKWRGFLFWCFAVIRSLLRKEDIRLLLLFSPLLKLWTVRSFSLLPRLCKRESRFCCFCNDIVCVCNDIVCFGILETSYDWTSGRCLASRIFHLVSSPISRIHKNASTH